MKYFRFLKRTSLCLFILALSSVSLTFANEKECLNEINVLVKHKEKAQFDGGFWTLFEKSRELSAQSVIGLNIDKEVNKLISHLTHLCETLEGIPLNDLAMIIRDDLKLMSEEEYRKQLVILGKPEKEIDIWFEFYSFSLKHEHRALDYPSVIETLNLSKELVSSYVKLYAENESKSNSETFKTQVESLLAQISSFTKSDKNIVQAESELSQVPYWDIQESVGGS